MPRRPTGPHDTRATGCALAWPGIVAAALLLPGPATAAKLPEPTLRLSPAIQAGAGDFPDEERALLRVEYKAAQTRAAEADIVADILARVRHMDHMITQVHSLVDAWPETDIAAPPTVSPPTASPSSAPSLVAPPPASTRPAAASPAPAAERPSPAIADADATSASGSLTMRALMASVIIFLFWLLGQRQRYFKAQRAKAGATPSEPAEAPATLIPDGAAGPEAVTASPAATIATPAAAMAVRSSLPSPAPSAATPAATASIAGSLNFEAVPGFGGIGPADAQQPLPARAPGSDQSLELGEIMVSMGLAHGAAEALIERIHSNPRRALYHWLKLLDVYRRSEMPEDFERATLELHQCFNVQPEGWEASGGGGSLEDYPHLAARLQHLWPGPECAAFLRGLLEDNRGGTRSGFPQSVAEEILLLEKMHDFEALPAAA